VEFTLYWPERGQWEGQNYSVAVERLTASRYTDFT
jgi:hypothetical protein